MREARETEDVILNALEGIEGRHWIKDRILTALSSAGIDCEGWRTIESAPKDGTKILIFNHNWDFAPVAKWVAHDGVDEDENGITFGGWGLDEFVSIPGACEEGFLGWNEDKEGNVMPTHWAPLPPLASGGG